MDFGSLQRSCSKPYNIKVLLIPLLEIYCIVTSENNALLYAALLCTLATSQDLTWSEAFDMVGRGCELMPTCCGLLIVLTFMCSSAIGVHELVSRLLIYHCYFSLIVILG